MATDTPSRRYWGSCWPQPEYGSPGWSQTVESPTRKIWRVCRAGVTLMSARAGAEPPIRRSRPGVPSGPVGSPSGVRTFTVKLRVTCLPAGVVVSGSRVRRVSPLTLVADAAVPPSTTRTSYVPGGTSKWQVPAAHCARPGDGRPGWACAGTDGNALPRATAATTAMLKRLTRGSSQ